MVGFLQRGVTRPEGTRLNNGLGSPDPGTFAVCHARDTPP